MISRWFVPLILIMALVSCNQMSSIDCADCYTSDPDSASLRILITINSQNQKVPFYFYLGQADNGELIYSDTISNSDFSLWLPTHRHYAAKAVYLEGQDTVYAFDGCHFKAKEVDNECNFDCYVFEKKQLDLRLKK